MKNISFLLVLSFLFLANMAWAQPTFYINPDFQLVDQNQQVCYDVKTRDFTDLIAISFSIRWNPGVANNATVTPSSLHPDLINLDMSDFVINNAEGYLTFDWSNGQNCQNPAPSSNVTLVQDDQTLFEICFNAVGIYGNHTEIAITDEPMDIYVKRGFTLPGASCQDIGDFTYNGFLSIGTNPLVVNISSADGFQGEDVCVDFSVENFDNLISTQYYIFWDKNVLTYQNALASGLPAFSAGANLSMFANQGFGVVSWNSVGGPISVPDGTQILQLCFKINGNCGQSSPIFIADNGDEEIEIIDAVTQGSNGTNIGLLDNPGEVSVKCFSPNGIGLDIQDKNVCPGESFTVDVNVSNFEEIVKLQFGLKWNPSIIHLTNVSGDGISFPNGEPCFQFDSPGVLKTFPNQGRIEVDWTGGFFSACDMLDGELLMRLHFQAVGPSQTNSTISVVQPILVDQQGGQVINIGINNDNGLVSICDLDNPTLIISSQDANPGENICLRVSTQDFEDILNTDYTISWEPSFLKFTGVQSFDLPGLDITDFDLSQAVALGNLGVLWSSTAEVSVPDGTDIFEICFDVLGDPDSCSFVQFTENLVETNIETLVSSGTDVGLNGQSGQVCALDPFDVAIIGDDVFGVPGEQVAVNISGENLLQMRKLQFTFGWDQFVIQYDSLTSTGALPNFSAIHYNENPMNIANGTLGINWSTNNINGITVPDGVPFLTLHFTIIGDPGDCSAIKVGPWVNQIVTNSAITGNANLGVESINGKVCVNQDFITVPSVVLTDVNCPSVATGAIDLTVEGGSGNYNFAWTGSGVIQNIEDQTGLKPGFYSVTITDSQNPSLNISLNFQVLLSPTAPIANAGPDTSFSCSTSVSTITLNGTGSSGAGITYSWQNAPGSLPGIFTAGQNTATPTVIGGSKYILTVTQASTGCVVKDTVMVSSPVRPSPPFINQNNLKTLTCENDTLILNGGQNPNLFSFEWTAGAGGHIVPGSDTSLLPRVTEPGRYYLRLFNPVTGCQGIDSIDIDEFKDFIPADAGEEGLLGCNDDKYVLNAGSTVEANAAYEWSVVGGGEICGAIDQITADACAPGIYQLTVTNTLNGCTDTDEVEVIGDTEKPIAIAGPNDSLTCVVLEVELDGSASSQGNDFEYAWLNSNGDTLTSEVIFTVTEPDTYTFVVLDTTNGCKSTSQKLVGLFDNKPVAWGTTDVVAITCEDTLATLSTIGSSVGAKFSYAWTDEMGNLVGTDTFTMVSEPGDYTLTVTNNHTGCTAERIVSIEDKNDAIPVAAGDDTTIDCSGAVPLEGSYTAPNANGIVVQWSGPGTPGCILNSATLTPTIECPGTYILTVQNQLTGCLGTDTLEVAADTMLPVVDAGDNAVFPCSDNEYVLQGSTNVTNATYLWENFLGNNINNETSLNASVDLPGVYTLTVTSLDNNCQNSSTVIITAPDLPTALIEGPDMTDCADPNVPLTGANSTAGVSYFWTTTTGQIPAGTENNVQISVPMGEYTLIVTDALGCTGTDTHIVGGSIDAPVADAGGDVEIACDETQVTLDGSNSDPGMTYQWTDANQQIIGSDLVVQVSQPGQYTLSVTNTANFCISTSTVNVSLATEGNVPAEASVDHEPCAGEAILIGNLPAGATGLWTSSTGATIEDPMAEMTMASNLTGGDNIFFWSLSLGRCDNYSTVQAAITIDQSVPSTVDDAAVIEPLNAGTVSINVLTNDSYDSTVTTFNVVSTNVIGDVEFTDSGVITYTKEKCYVGRVEIEYELCNTDCPDLCTSGFLLIDIQEDPEEGCDDVPNGITPNGDGLNDELIFDDLLGSEDKYPNNELIIFNRWGDVVYKARPYQNDWNGTNNDGQRLPHATYYYVFRLDVANSKIIRGDVTILD